VNNQARYGEPGVQERAIQLLKNTESFELEPLKDSIVTNGYVPIEQIVVFKYNEQEEDARYLVVEGNRRVAAVKSILFEHTHGTVDISEDKLQTLRELPIIELIGAPEERRQYQQTLMAIRHIAGIREWGPYQQAKLIVELYENEKHAFGQVAQPVGISAREVARRYRASKALQQMEEDEEFGEHASPKLYVFSMKRCLSLKFENGWTSLMKRTRPRMVSAETGVLEHSLAQAFQAIKASSIDAWLNPSERAIEIWSEFVKVVDQIKRLMHS
jgi:hypothetical protein